MGAASVAVCHLQENASAAAVVEPDLGWATPATLVWTFIQRDGHCRTASVCL